MPRIAWMAAAVALLALPAAALADEPKPYELPPAPTPTFEVPATPQFTPPVVVTPEGPHFITPFPIVRISGRLTDDGAVLTRLSVRAPRGTKVTVVCKRRGCPKRRVARIASTLRFKPYQRRLRAGVRLEVSATSPNLIGKWVAITIRRGKPPKRSDRCLMPDSKVPVTCPTL